MQTVVLYLARFELVLAGLDLHWIAHLCVVVDVLDHENLRHLQDDQKLHRHELIEEEVEREEGSEGLFSGTRCVLEHVPHLLLVLRDERVCLRGEGASDDQDQEDVEGHEGVDALVQAGLFEAILALVHDQFAIGRRVDDQARDGPRIA